jgi:hypothetical protein
VLLLLGGGPWLEASSKKAGSTERICGLVHVAQRADADAALAAKFYLTWACEVVGVQSNRHVT